VASGDRSTVGGGGQNSGGGTYSTIGGGNGNQATMTASTVAGGQANVAGGIGSTVAGGILNEANGNASFAAGTRAKANHGGTFVWGDSQPSDMASSATDQFIARAQGHFFLQSDSSLDNQSGFINTSTGAFLSTGGTWTNASSRRLKTGFARISPVQILERVAGLPISAWRYKTEPGVRHIGPVSEDFHRAFHVGESSRSIPTVDADGIALAAIQGLYRENQALKKQNRGLRGHMDVLRAQMKVQNARLTRLEHAFSALSR
jgi:trimeric autotransporter adhesin